MCHVTNVVRRQKFFNNFWRLKVWNYSVLFHFKQKWFEDDFRFGATGNPKLFLQVLKPFEILSFWALDVDHFESKWSTSRAQKVFDDYFLSDRQLKTLFNIVEAPLKKWLNFDVCIVWWCSDGPLLNSQHWYKSFEIYAVSIKISMIEYHHWIDDLVDHLF